MRNQLLQLQRSLNVFLKKARRKFIFEQYENESEVLAFQRLLDEGMKRQANAVLDEETLTSIAGLVTKADESVRDRVFTIVKNKWQSIGEFISSDDFFGFFVWAGELGGKVASKTLGLDGIFSLSNQSILEQFREREKFLIDSLDTTGLNALQNVFIEGVDLGLSSTELQELLNLRIPEITSYRAEVIARTELANSAMSVSKESFIRNGVREWQWSKSPGDEDVCSQNHNITRVIGRLFPSGHEKPPVHPNCKCDCVPVIDKDALIDNPWLGD